MNKYLLIIWILIFPIRLLSQEITGELTYLNSNTPIKIGSFIEVKLLLGPEGEKYLRNIEESVGKNLIKGFYLQEVRNIQVLQGGEDFLEADLTLIPIASFDPGIKYELKIGEVTIPVELNNFLGEQPDINPSNFIILEQSVKGNWLYIKMAITLITLLTFLAGYFLWKRAKNKRVEKERERARQEIINTWKNKIREAKERSDFEHIYLNREIWIAMLPQLKNYTDSFFMSVEKHQYKPRWTEAELGEVKNSIKRIIDGV